MPGQRDAGATGSPGDFTDLGVIDAMTRPRLTGPDGRLVWQRVCRVGGTSDDRTLQIDRPDFGPQDGDNLKTLIELGTERCAEQIAASLVRM